MTISFIYPYALWLLLLLPLTAGLALWGRRPASQQPAASGGTRTLRRWTLRRYDAPLRFWAGLALRLFLLTLIILALAGAQVRRRADVLTAVFLLDASDSVSEEEQARGEALIRQAIGAMPAGDRAAVVIFGRDALVERLASEERSLPAFASVPVTVRTDIASALQLALALFPDEGAKRMVLLSDGRENLGRALAQAELAAAHQVQLTFVPLGRGDPGGRPGQEEVEVRVESLDAPGDVRQGQGFDLTATVHSTTQGGATLRVFGDDQLIHSEEVSLREGANRFVIPIDPLSQFGERGPGGEGGGFRRFRAQILPDADTWLQNNEASAFTVVHGPPRVLLVEGQPGEGDNLSEALRTVQMEVIIAPPDQLPATLPELAAYDAVVLANVASTSLPAPVMDSLQVYVRDLGRGLLMTGGENSFGAGGYLRTPLEETLPVDMDVRTKEQSPNLALVLAVDKSGSMGRCHCDNPDLNQTYQRREVGQPKVDIAKEAIMRAASALGQEDYLGVVAFDDRARWALDLTRLATVGSFVDLEQSVGGIQAAGQTNLRSGVEAAYDALQGAQARRKHLILLTDGWVHEGELTGLAREMHEQGITLSVVAAGEGSAEYLEDLAQSGGGRYYPATDILRVPDFFLKETVTAVGQYIVEEAFYPLPSQTGSILRGLDPAALPPLFGYNGTTPKSTAFVALFTPRGDPLLAQWQYGLGRAAAWTSDLKGQWATEWVAWEGFPRFAAQLVGWTLPAPQVEGLQAQARLVEDRAVLHVEAVEPPELTAEGSGGPARPRNFLDITATLVGPDLSAEQVSLPQVGPGRYEAQVEVSQPGTYLVRLGVSDANGGRALGQQTLGLVVPYSPEYKASGVDLPWLRELAGRTGGGELAQPETAFTHNLPPAARAREIWGTLLLIAALLFPLDVALRRVTLRVGSGEVRQAAAWLRDRLPTRRQAVREERVLGRLFRARDRALGGRPRPGAPPPRPPAPRPPQGRVPPAPPAPSPPQPNEPEPKPQAPSDEDALARLREAKKRARRDR